MIGGWPQLLAWVCGGVQEHRKGRRGYSGYTGCPGEVTILGLGPRTAGLRRDRRLWCAWGPVGTGALLQTGVLFMERRGGLRGRGRWGAGGSGPTLLSPPLQHPQRGHRRIPAQGAAGPGAFRPQRRRPVSGRPGLSQARVCVWQGGLCQGERPQPGLRFHPGHHGGQ